jgi:hypothetical protein
MSAPLLLSTLRQRIELLGEFFNLPEAWLAKSPNLFSKHMVTLMRAQDLAIKEAIYAINEVVNHSQYLEFIKQYSPPMARLDPKTSGVLCSFDFHMDASGPKLIEINTNAAGAGFAALQRLAMDAFNAQDQNVAQPWQEQMLSMFLREWSKKRNTKLKTLAIVDENPTQQHFYYEFLIFQELFKNYGIDTFILDPSQLELHQNRLSYNKLPIDLIYNRLTDFYLDKPEHQSIQQAYLEDAVVLTPNPFVHAKYANKQNLITLSNKTLLHEWQIPESIITILQKIVPKTIKVAPHDAETLWNQRKQLFFKPYQSYGSKGAYAGSKLTHKTFSEILQADYIAQEFIPPSEFTVYENNSPTHLKIDLRYYTYEAEVIQKVARIYRGQTTNLNTPGGGFGYIQIK